MGSAVLGSNLSKKMEGECSHARDRHREREVEDSGMTLGPRLRGSRFLPIGGIALFWSEMQYRFRYCRALLHYLGQVINRFVSVSIAIVEPIETIDIGPELYAPTDR